jgi:GNAT superfamily N-acetyltransferase
VVAAVREARQEDVHVLLQLVRELASYEKEPDAVVATEDSLGRALFGASAVARALVAEEAGVGVVGMAIWFLAFSTWTGRPTLYLEDLFVRDAARRAGTGRALLTELARRARQLGCSRMDWSVLDWNETAISFYRSVGAQPLDGWTTYRLEGEGLERLAGSEEEGEG